MGPQEAVDYGLIDQVIDRTSVGTAPWRLARGSGLAFQVKEKFQQFFITEVVAQSLTVGTL
jgi:hypothetical protein